jgi:hypothetical protein
MFTRQPKIRAQTGQSEQDRTFSTGVPADTSSDVPMGMLTGDAVNPHVLRGQIDLDTRQYPNPRFVMSRGMHDVQLSNGWQYTNYGLICNYRNEGYLAEVVPTVPGQSRLYGAYGPPAGFVPRSNAPSQWQNAVNAVQQQPANPGGPGQYMGNIVSTGARG